VKPIAKAVHNLRQALQDWWGPAVWSAADLYELERFGIAFSGPIERPHRATTASAITVTVIFMCYMAARNCAQSRE
jgi:hypothetical protein